MYKVELFDLSTLYLVGVIYATAETIRRLEASFIVRFI